MAETDDKNIVVNPSATAQVIKVSENFGKIRCPSRILIAGPTMSGKSMFALELVRHRNIVFDSSFDRIIYCLPGENLPCVVYEKSFLNFIKKYN